MLTTCDRCAAPLTGPHGIRSVHKDGRVLDLCDHHHGEHRDALVKQGWTAIPLSVVAAETPIGRVL